VISTQFYYLSSSLLRAGGILPVTPSLSFVASFLTVHDSQISYHRHYYVQVTTFSHTYFLYLDRERCCVYSPNKTWCKTKRKRKKNKLCPCQFLPRANSNAVTMTCGCPSTQAQDLGLLKIVVRQPTRAPHSRVPGCTSGHSLPSLPTRATDHPVPTPGVVGRDADPQCSRHSLPSLPAAVW
jgi:hypothetical protein